MAYISYQQRKTLSRFQVGEKSKALTIIKKFFQVLWDEFIYGGHLHSLGVSSFILSLVSIIGMKISLDAFFIIYFGLHSAYLFNRYKEYREDLFTNKERTRHIKRYLSIIPFIVSVMFFIILIILLTFGNLSSIFLGISLFIIGLIYSVKSKEVTKRIIGFKNVATAGMFSSLIVFLTVYYSYSLDISIVLLIFFVFMRVFNNTIFFDIKDVESDKKNKLMTLPIVLSDRLFDKVWYIINVFSFLPIIIGIVIGRFPFYSLVLLFAVVYCIFYFRKAKECSTKLEHISYVWADGEYLFIALSIMLAKFYASYIF